MIINKYHYISKNINYLIKLLYFYKKIDNETLKIFMYQIKNIKNKKDLIQYYNQLKCKYNCLKVNYLLINNNQPNFIIIVSGQSNASGFGSYYEKYHLEDQIDKNIFSYNRFNGIWEIADLQNQSLKKIKGSNFFGFHFAKELVKKYPGIKPGIINLSYASSVIGCWIKYSTNHKYYQLNQTFTSLSNKKQGIFFDEHQNIIKKAFKQLEFSIQRKIDVVLWHQGESDNIFHNNSTFFRDSLYQVVNQYKSIEKSIHSYFIAGTVLPYTLKGTYKNFVNPILMDLNQYSNCGCVDFSKLSSLHDIYQNNDYIHFSTQSQRTMGKLYFEKYIELIEKNQ
jgi:hypothetical protein